MTNNEPSAVTDCLFCSIVEGIVPADVVYTSELSVAFRDISPQAPVHVLIVPRRHIDNAQALVAADAIDLTDLLLVAQEVAEIEGIADPDRGYRLAFNVGRDALNSVGHLHLHVLGGRTLGGMG